MLLTTLPGRLGGEGEEIALGANMHDAQPVPVWEESGEAHEELLLDAVSDAKECRGGGAHSRRLRKSQAAMLRRAISRAPDRTRPLRSPSRCRLGPAAPTTIPLTPAKSSGVVLCSSGTLRRNLFLASATYRVANDHSAEELGGHIARWRH